MSLIPEAAVRALREVSKSPHVLTIGNFDGVHRGHRYLLNYVNERAENYGARSLVVTFEPHPITVVAPDRPYFRLSTPEQKVQLLHEAGVNDVAVVPFTNDFAAVSPHDFLKLLYDEVSPVEVVVGDEFRFGRGRSGDGDLLQSFAENHGFRATILKRLDEDGEILSSSLIRAALRAGELDEATRILGRRYRLRGLVVRGEGRGRKLGYPTANLDIPEEMLIPGNGIYAVFVDGINDGKRSGMAYIGTSATFDRRERTVEVHVFDFDGDLYDRELDIEFVAHTRDDIRFESVESLVEQMGVDEQETREILLELKTGRNEVNA